MLLLGFKLLLPLLILKPSLLLLLLLLFPQIVERSRMLFEERLEAAERRRREGNELFAQEKYLEALSKYAMVRFWGSRCNTTSSVSSAA
jgi:hypothetical protein